MNQNDSFYQQLAEIICQQQQDKNKLQFSIEEWPPSLQIPPEGVVLSDLKEFIKNVFEGCLGSIGIGNFTDPFFNQLPSLEGVFLTRLEVVPGEDGCGAAFFVGFQLIESWSIISDSPLPNTPALVLSNPGFTIGSSGGLDASYLVDVYGTLEIFGLALEVMVQWPAMIITGALARELDLQAMLAEAGFVDQVSFGEGEYTGLKIRALMLKMDLYNKAFDFTFGMSGWEILPGALTFKNLLLDLSLSEEHKSASVRAQINLCNIEIDLTGVFQDGQVEFSGSTGAGQEIHIGYLIADLSRMFGANPQLPPALEELTIKDLSVSFNTKDKEFKFACEGELPVGAQSKLATNLVIEVKQSEFDFSGQFNVQMDATPLEFKFECKHGSQTDKLFASYHHDGNLPLNISELLIALIPGDDQLEDLIKGLDIEVDVKDIKLAFCKEASAAPDKEGSEPEKASKSLFGMNLDAEVSFNNPSGGKVTADINSFLLASTDRGATDQHTSQFLFGCKIGAELSLSSQPLVGPLLPAGQTVGVKDLQFFAVSQPISDMGYVNDLLGADNLPMPRKDPQAQSANILEHGVTVDALLMLGSESRNLVLAPSGAAKQADQEAQVEQAGQDEETGQEPISSTEKDEPEEKAPPAGSAEIQPARSAVKWIPIQKSFGPVRFDRLGFQFQDQMIWFLLDTSLSAAGLTISLQGLSLGSRITKFEPCFDLQGLGITFKNDQVEISGALLKHVQNDNIQYSGQALIKTKSFMLSAIGSYASVEGIGPSMFIFAYLDMPLGGPTCFYVTGLAAGFGYNSLVRIPAIQEVKDFPLLAAMVDPSKIGGKDASPMEVLGKMGNWIQPQQGTFWLAAGISFRSFEIIKSNVLAIAQFGQDFQLLLLGFSTLQLPQQGKIYAYAELMIQVMVKPAEGVVAAMALLTPNSYLIDPACHLTGGFAFFLWFGNNPHAGDFVLTLGGYHPAFQVPVWYPQPNQVPRLGFTWPVSSNVMIKGEAYFALTPSCVMAGGRLEVLYTSGNLQAWFIAQADMIVYWKPFYFEASISVCIGVSYRVKVWFIHKTLRAELGAWLELWGPPTGGRVHISLSFISFTVSFGAGRQTASPTLDWEGFKTMLPQKKDKEKNADLLAVIQINVNNGLLQQADNQETGKKYWIVRPDEFTFSIETAIPATKTRLNNQEIEKAPAASIGIRPMGIGSIVSPLTITICEKDSNAPITTTEWEYAPYTRNLPEAMWGQPINGSPKPEAKLIDNCMVGLQNIRLKPNTDTQGPPKFMVEDAFQYSPIQPDTSNPIPDLPLSPAQTEPATGFLTTSDTLTTIQQTLMDRNIKESRTAVFKALKDMGVNDLTDGDLSTMAANIAGNLEASPMVGTLVPAQ